MDIGIKNQPFPVKYVLINAILVKKPLIPVLIVLKIVLEIPVSVHLELTKMVMLYVQIVLICAILVQKPLITV